MGLNCRTIHAQLQQRQRLRALEAFRSSPVGVLVATDVAARGLDISKIQSVLHYDIARSPQVYVHRSGRTARASQSGVTVSLVAPEDSVHHSSICTAQGLAALPVMTVDRGALPIIRDRVRVAKKIFTQSFVASQSMKEKNWLHQNAKDADLELDDYLLDEVGTGDVQQEKTVKSKKALERARMELKNLLETPIEVAKSGIGSRKRGFVVFAK